MDPIDALEEKVTETFNAARLLVGFVHAGGHVEPGAIEAALAEHERASNEYTAAVLAAMREKR